MKKLIVILFLGVIATSCLSDLDFDKVNKVTLNSEWVVPLVKTHLRLSDLVEEDSVVTVDSDNLIRIIYEKDSIFGYGISDFAQIPAQAPTVQMVKVGDPPLSLSTSLNTIAGASLKSASFSSGGIQWTVTNPSTGNVDILFDLGNGTFGNGNPTTFNLNGVGTSTTGYIDLSGTSIDFTIGPNPYNNLDLTFEVLSSSTAPAGTDIEISIEFINLVPNDVVGYLGNRDHGIPSSSFQVDLGGIEKFVSGLYLENPIIKLNVASNIGLPLQLDLDIDGISKDGTIEALSLVPQTIQGPTVPGTWDTTQVLIDKNSSNIVDFISNLPSNLLFDGIVVSNPNGNTGIDNFILADGAVSVDLKMELPLELRADNMMFEQEIPDINWGSLRDQDNPIEKLDLYFAVDNGFPLETDLELVLLNAIGNPIDTFSIPNLMMPAAVNANGRVTAPARTNAILSLDTDQLNKLLLSESLLIRTHLNTTNNGQTVVKIYNDYSMEVAIAVRTKLNLELTQ